MPYLALLFNALVWGLSWWPLRQLQAQGLHPLWATLLFFLSPTCPVCKKLLPVLQSVQVPVLLPVPLLLLF